MNALYELVGEILTLETQRNEAAEEEERERVRWVDANNRLTRVRDNLSEIARRIALTTDALDVIARRDNLHADVIPRIRTELAAPQVPTQSGSPESPVSR